jgi:rubredoxin
VIIASVTGLPTQDLLNAVGENLYGHELMGFDVQIKAPAVVNVDVMIEFTGDADNIRSANGIRYISESANAVISGKVAQAIDCGTHTLFIADVTESFVLSPEPSVTYQYYFDHIKPAPKKPTEKKPGYICKICGYFHEGETLPEDIVCPLCKHGAEDFERVN